MTPLWIALSFAAGIGTGILLIRIGIEMEFDVERRVAARNEQDLLSAE